VLILDGFKKKDGSTVDEDKEQFDMMIKKVIKVGII